MKRINIFAALACALLVLSLVGCGSNNKLQSITLSVAQINGLPVTGAGGVVNLAGDGTTIQLQAMGQYSNSKDEDITDKVTYTVIIDPNYTETYTGAALLPPCGTAPCPSPSTPPFTTGTVEYNQTGLITAVEPAVCTWVENGTGWFFQGAYQVTASLAGVTSQPVIIPVASEAGPGANGQCGPTSGS
ncbi:MAG: hypothetical protein WBS24_17085 [Terriglobales bacterium]